MDYGSEFGFLAAWSKAKYVGHGEICLISSSGKENGIQRENI